MSKHLAQCVFHESKGDGWIQWKEWSRECICSLPTPNREVRLTVLSLELRSGGHTRTAGHPRCGFVISNHTWDGASSPLSPWPFHNLLSHSLIYHPFLSTGQFTLNLSQMSLLFLSLIKHSSPNYYHLSLGQREVSSKTIPSTLLLLSFRLFSSLKPKW